MSQLRNVAELVGSFIRYWGFRQIHGEVWTLVFLAKSPLSGADIVKKLGVSKALVSPALKELEAEGLVRQIPSENFKTKRYEAEENVTAVIRNVLERREKPMIAKIRSEFAKLQQSPKPKNDLDPERLKAMNDLIETAHSSLNLVLDMGLFDGR